MKAMNKTLVVLALSALCSPALGQQPPQVWTWTGGNSTFWTDTGGVGNWSCIGDDCPPPPAYPDDKEADVIIPNVTNAPIVDQAGGQSYNIKTLTLNPNAVLTIPKGTCNGTTACMGIIVAAHDGLKLSSGSKISIQGGYLQLTGGGKLDIHPDAMIIFETTANGRLLFSRGNAPYRAPVYEILGGSSNEVIRADVHGIIESVDSADNGSIGAGGGNTLVLWDREITGFLTIYVRLINNGRVVADELGHWITLACQPKGGSGIWRMDHNGAKIIAWTPVTGTAESRIELIDGVLSLADLWVTAGTLDWQGGTISADPRTGLFAGESVSCTN